MTLSTYFDAVANALTPTVGTAKPVHNKAITFDFCLIWRFWVSYFRLGRVSKSKLARIFGRMPFLRILPPNRQLLLHHHHPTTRRTWCKHNSASGPRYKVSVTHVVSVRKPGKTDGPASLSKYGMMRR